jgi:hypothetical protein
VLLEEIAAPDGHRSAAEQTLLAEVVGLCTILLKSGSSQSHTVPFRGAIYIRRRRY